MRSTPLARSGVVEHRPATSARRRRACRRVVPRLVGVLGVTLTGCGGGETSSDSSSGSTTSVATTSRESSSTASTSSTRAPSPTSTTTTSTSSTSTSSTTTTIPEPDAELVSAAPTVGGYGYREFAVSHPSFEGGTAVATEITGASDPAFLTIEAGPAPFAFEDQMEVLRLVESVYGRQASSHVGWQRADDFPMLAFGDAEGEHWLWFHDGLLFHVEGDPSIVEFISGAGAAQHEEPGPSQESIALLEGSIPSRFMEIAGYTNVVPPPGMILNALEAAVKEGVHYATRVVAGPGTAVAVVDEFNVEVHGSEVVFVEASEMSLLNWGSLASVAPVEGDQGNGVRVEFVGDVPVYMADSNWQWVDGPMYMTAWIGDPEVFAQMRPYLEQLVSAQAAQPLATDDWWLE
jgi:hypothetical protein